MGGAAPAASSLAEGTPIVCRQCGGSMRLEANLVAVCPFCGARDTLPAEEAARYLELKGRLAIAHARSAQVRGMDAALAGIFEDRGAFLRLCGVYLAVAGVTLAMTLASVFSTPGLSSAGNVPGNVRGELWLSVLMSPSLTLGIAASLGVALLAGRAHFRKTIRPHLLARPVSTGASFVCRACGGPIPPGSDVSVTCRHCGSVNLVPRSLHEATQAAIHRQAEGAHAQVQQANVRLGSISRRMEWIAGAGIALTVLTVYAAPSIVAHLAGWR